MRTFTKVRDLDMKILAELSYKELVNKCSVNKYVADLCQDNNLWRNKIAKDFPLRGKFVWFADYRDMYQNDPRQLYEIINKKSKIVELSGEDFPEMAARIQEDEVSEEDLQWMTDQIIPHLSDLPLLRGDVFHLEWQEEYRNSGKFIWDGEKVLELDGALDDYGAVPKEFSFPEFPIDHFYESIDHNNLIWIAPNKVQEIIKNFNEETQKSFVTDGYETYPVISGATDDEEKLISLTKEQFAKYVMAYPFFDEHFPDAEMTEGIPEGTAVVGRSFGSYERLFSEREERREMFRLPPVPVGATSPVLALPRIRN